MKRMPGRTHRCPRCDWALPGRLLEAWVGTVAERLDGGLPTAADQSHDPEDQSVLAVPVPPAAVPGGFSRRRTPAGLAVAPAACRRPARTYGRTQLASKLEPASGSEAHKPTEWYQILGWALDSPCGP